MMADDKFAKYAKVVKITRAPVERVARNMMEDGLSQDDINRFLAVFDPDFVAPEGSGSAGYSGDDPLLLSFAQSLEAAENNIISRFQVMMDEREKRILAAIGGSSEVIADEPEQGAYEEEEEDTPVAAPKPAAPKPAAPKPAAPARPSKTIQTVASDFDLPDKTDWAAIQGVRSTSGVFVEEHCKEAYDMVRRSRTGIRWVMFQFDSTMCWIIPTKKGEATEDYEADWAGLVEQLPERDACYVLYNFTYSDSGGSGYALGGNDVLKSKMTLFAWTDAKCKVKTRMVAASSQSAIKQVCKGSVDQPIHDKAELKFETMMDTLSFTR